MPQLDFSVFPSQLFWLCITFFTMLFIMSKFIIPKTAEMINLRKEKIDGYLQKAAELKEKVEETLDKYNKALQKATEEANQSLQKTQQELDASIERKQAELQDRASLSFQIGVITAALAFGVALASMTGIGAVIAIGTSLYVGGRILKAVIAREMNDSDKNVK